MGNKTITYILSVLFIITFSLGAYGYMNKDSVNSTLTPTPLNTNVNVIEYNNFALDVSSLDNKISNFEFVKANKVFDSNYLKVSIINNEVKVDIKKEGITNNNEEMKEVITYNIKDVNDIIAVQGQMSKNEENLTKIYMLDKYGRLFLSIFNANPNYYQNITTYYYKIDDVSSFTTLSIPLLNEGSVSDNYCIFKTNDETYYTDYNHGNFEEINISKINMITIDNNNSQ